MKTIKKIKDIVLIPVNDGRLTVFQSALEKDTFRQLHIDADMSGNYAADMENEFYQILLRGIATNKLTLLEFGDYQDYKSSLDYFRDSNYHLIVTTNFYKK